MAVDELRPAEDLDTDEARETLCAPLWPPALNELVPLTFAPREADAVDAAALVERVEPERAIEPLLTAVLAPEVTVPLVGRAEMP